VLTRVAPRQTCKDCLPLDRLVVDATASIYRQIYSRANRAAADPNRTKKGPGHSNAAGASVCAGTLQTGAQKLSRDRAIGCGR
jgi:hypothetical protein